jgi:RNA polymerase sigma-70 factor (ECF subfamily)
MSRRVPFQLESDLSDEALVDRVLHGETSLFAVLVRRYNQRLFRSVRAVLQNDADAEDALQQAYLSAFRYLSMFQQRSRLSTWLFRIAIREAFARRRKSIRQHEVHKQLASWAPVYPPAPEQLAAGRETASLLEEAIDALPEPYRLVFVLREVQELSTSEVAEVLALSEQNVRVRAHRGRELMKKMLRGPVDWREAYWFAGPRCVRMLLMVMKQLRGSPLPTIYGNELSARHLQ